MCADGGEGAGEEGEWHSARALNVCFHDPEMRRLTDRRKRERTRVRLIRNVRISSDMNTLSADQSLLVKSFVVYYGWA